MFKVQTIFAADIEADDHFVFEGTAWTATLDAYQDTDDSYVFIPVMQLTPGGMEVTDIIRTRGDNAITVVQWFEPQRDMAARWDGR